MRKYEITQKLGKGAYAVVFKGVEKKSKEAMSCASVALQNSVPKKIDAPVLRNSWKRSTSLFPQHSARLRATTAQATSQLDGGTIRLGGVVAPLAMGCD